MLSLTKELENELIIGKWKLQANLAFDNVLRWYSLLEDKEISDIGKASLTFEMFFDACCLDQEYLFKALKTLSVLINTRPYGKDTVGGERCFSFTQDAEAIYAGFMQQYGIDLVDMQGKLHWDKFIALFSGLTDDTEFKKIIEIRQRSTAGLKGDELQSLVQAQLYYQLDDDRSEEAHQQQQSDMFEALKNQALKE